MLPFSMYVAASIALNVLVMQSLPVGPALLPMLVMIELQKLAVPFYCSMRQGTCYWLSFSDKGKVTDSSI